MKWEIISSQTSKVTDENAITYYERSKHFLERGDIEQALKEIDKGIEYSNNDIKYIVQKYLILIKSNKYEQALEILELLIRKEPREALFYYEKFKILVRDINGQENSSYYVNCLKYLVISYALNSNEFRGGLGAVYKAEEYGYPEKAFEYLNLIIEINPNISIAYKIKANMLKEAGKLEEAVTNMYKAINIEKTVLYYLNLISMLYDLERYEEVIQNADEILNLLSLNKVSCDEDENDSIPVLLGYKAQALKNLD
ncbi:hypothetical protein Ccar_17800 [Clostridium carboxidivorans P7]|uniref:Tetratricopeptide domain protein n=1 Tax=Clostridium carboxidivorans P7 TaxID=536227 RepID=C6PSE1_9CLOT|nr:hypothetical protein [Clostridium carboxidivorans]AKN32600.1 hypothetical protein Ccar_17800 [Clostridium carboxidivorans P7]EET87819.1 Tetratricopeptide domain protein [Clostridium carboxidivorans P7]EFG90191.1 tetratricopeptide repeat protein [Clostridium carboxidivorans P7]